MKNWFITRPRARLKIGGRYAGATSNYTAQGYVVFKQYDARDRKHYYWEEWELTGFDNYDSWVEYDHYSKKVTVYRPTRLDYAIDPTKLSLHDGVVVGIGGKNVPGTVSEIGSGTVTRLRGKMSYQLFDDDTINYVELTMTGGYTISVEDYRQRHDKDLDYYYGTVLTKTQQKHMFGRVITPRDIQYSSLLYPLFFIGFIAASVWPRYETVCTPRTVPATSSQSSVSSLSPSSTTSQQTYTTEQSCSRVRVYGEGGGSSGGGVGK